MELVLVIFYLPAQCIARPIRYKGLPRNLHLVRYLPRLPDQRYCLLVTRQTVEIRPKMTGEPFQLFDGRKLIEQFSIEFNCRWCRIATGAATRGFFLSCAWGAESVPKKNF